MKGKDGVDSNENAGPTTPPTSRIESTSRALDTSSMSSFLNREQFCKELYLSMGVHPGDVADTSDDDVESILEQINRFHPSNQNSAEGGGGGDRNIEDILREAESLLDGQQASVSVGPKSGSIRSKGAPDAPKTCHHSRLTKFTSEKFPITSQTCLPEGYLNTTQTLHASALGSDSSLQSNDSFGSNLPKTTVKDKNSHETLKPSHVGTPLEVTYKRIYEQIRKEVDGTLEPHLTGDFPDFKLSLPIPGLDTPAIDAPGCFNLEKEFLEERKRCLKLKADLDWLKRQHEQEFLELRQHHEGQLNQIREELRTTSNQNPSLQSLQIELKSKEQMISQYQQESEKMRIELHNMKRLLLKLMALLNADNGSV